MQNFIIHSLKEVRKKMPAGNRRRLVYYHFAANPESTDFT